MRVIFPRPFCIEAVLAGGHYDRYRVGQAVCILTRTMPLGTRGSSHCATTVFELTARARTLIGALLGTVHTHRHTDKHHRMPRPSIISVVILMTINLFATQAAGLRHSVRYCAILLICLIVLQFCIILYYAHRRNDFIIFKLLYY